MIAAPVGGRSTRRPRRPMTKSSGVARPRPGADSGSKNGRHATEAAITPAPPSVAELLGRYWREIPSLWGFSPDDLKRTNRVMYLIPRCRTGRLGSAPFTCEGCGDSALRLRSCHDRHCPTCNGQKRKLWRDRLVEWSLDCDYLHVVFTLPHELNELIRRHPKAMHNLQFRCVTDVLTQTAAEEYGCRVGMVQVLHTWGQRLGLHVHIHIVMTAGGVSLDGLRWLPISASDAGMQRAVLAAKFRKTYLRRLKTMIKNGKVSCEDPDRLIEKVSGKDWIVNCEGAPPHCQGPEAVINYLGSYVIGGPIGDGRVIADDGEMVTIRFKNYATGAIEHETMPGAEFARRYAQHILPRNLTRVRYTGLFQACGRAERLEQCQKLIAEAGLTRKSDGTSAAMPVGIEYDEDQVEESSTEDHGRSLECVRCSKRMRTEQENWISGESTRAMLTAVAEVLVDLRRDGESILIQIYDALLHHPAITDRFFSDYQRMLLESMLMECVDDPRPLLTSTLGRNHPLIVEARERPPPHDEEDADVV